MVAVVDWFAVATDRRHLEYAGQAAAPGGCSSASALSLDVAQPSVRAAVVVALVLSLVGDVALMLPGEHWFVFGLAAFLVAHLAYVVAFWWRGVASGALRGRRWWWWPWPWPCSGGASCRPWPGARAGPDRSRWSATSG